jgi:hypothetical protein
MGIEWLEVKLDDLFEDGQGYVALSRAIKLEGLRVVAFAPERFRVSQQVITFYDQHIRGRSRPERTEERTWRPVFNWAPTHPKHVDMPVSTRLTAARGRGPYDDWQSASVKRRKGLIGMGDARYGGGEALGLGGGGGGPRPGPGAAARPGEWLPNRPQAAAGLPPQQQQQPPPAPAVRPPPPPYKPGQPPPPRAALVPAAAGPVPVGVGVGVASMPPVGLGGLAAPRRYQSPRAAGAQPRGPPRPYGGGAQQPQPPRPAGQQQQQQQDGVSG